MTSVATLVERLRRAVAGADPVRDAAVVLSEFIDDGGVEPVDDPFHPARRGSVAGAVALVSEDPTVVLTRSTSDTESVPQRHGVPVAVALLAGRLAIDVHTVDAGDDPEGPPPGEDGETRPSLGDADTTSELAPGDVYVLEGDVVHRLRFVGNQPGLALHVALGDLGRVARTVWIDGRPVPVEPSRTYPLAGSGR